MKSGIQIPATTHSAQWKLISATAYESYIHLAFKGIMEDTGRLMNIIIEAHEIHEIEAAILEFRKNQPENRI